MLPKAERICSDGTCGCWILLLAGLCLVHPSVRRGLRPQRKVPGVPGASQCLLVMSFITMPSASTVTAAATASPRRTISSLVDMALPGGSPWGSGWKVAPSSLVMPVSTTPFCASTPAATTREQGQQRLWGSRVLPEVRQCCTSTAGTRTAPALSRTYAAPHCSGWEVSVGWWGRSCTRGQCFAGGFGARVQLLWWQRGHSCAVLSLGEEPSAGKWPWSRMQNPGFCHPSPPRSQ